MDLTTHIRESAEKSAQEALIHVKRLLVALGIFTPFTALLKTAWPGDPLAETRALLLLVSLAFALFVVAEAWYFLKDRSMRRFFGLRRKKRLIIALPSWAVADKQTLGKRNYETGRFETRSTRNKPGTSQWNLDTLARVLSSQPALRKLNPEYVLDESLFNLDSNTPNFLHQHKGRKGDEEDVTIVSYGASSSNHICRFVLSQPILRDDPHVYHFVDEQNLITKETDYFLGRRAGIGEAQDDLDARYDEKAGYDFGLLLRLTIRRVFADDRPVVATIFICAGLDQYGSEATLEYLFENWRHLDIANRGRDFYYLCRVSEDPLQLEDFMLHGVRSADEGRFAFSAVQ